jgi:hypothetical protein
LEIVLGDFDLTVPLSICARQALEIYINYIKKNYNSFRGEVAYYTARLIPIQYGLKQGDAVSPMSSTFVLEYAIRKINQNQEVLKLNGTHRLLVYDYYVTILGENIKQ